VRWAGDGNTGDTLTLLPFEDGKSLWIAKARKKKKELEDACL
jgi:hypothetical protein